MKYLVAMSLGIGALAGSPAWGQTNADRVACTAIASKPGVRAEACRRAIATKTLAGRSLAVAYYNLGTAELALKRPREAELAFSEALELTPGDVSARYNRSLAYFRQNAYDKAVADLTLVIEREPDHVKAYNNRGVAYYQLGQFEEAAADFSAAIQREPGRADRYMYRGTAYYKLTQFGKAIADYTAAIERAPRNAAAFYNRGLAYERLGNRGKARADFQAALAVEADHAGAKRGLTRLEKE